MAAKREELLKFKIEADGDRDLANLASKLLELSKGSDVAADQAQQLIDELQKLSSVSAGIKGFVTLKASIADTSAQLVKAKQQLASVRAEFDATDAPTKRLEKSLARATAEVDKLTKSQNKQQAELQRTSNTLRASGVDIDKLGSEYADLQQDLTHLGASADKMAKGLSTAGTATKNAASGVDVLDRAAKASSASLGAIAARLTVVSGAALGAVKALAAISGAALFTGAVESAASLEDALSQVQAVSGASAAEMVKLKAAAEAGGAATKFSTLEAAQGLGELARATGDATTAIAALPATLALAQAAGIGVAEAATMMTTTLTQFGLGADQASRVADVMAKEVNSTTDSMSGLGNALSYVAPLAKSLGLDIEDTAAILGVLADEGFRGERAGTALRSVFTEMMDPASNFAKELRSLGIETSDFAEVITQLAAKGDRGKQALLQLDAAARPAITALVDKGSAKLGELEASLRNASGEAQRTADVMGDNLSGAIESIKDSFDRTRRSLVEPLLEPLKDELQTLAAELEAFAASPEFEEIKTALKGMFIEGAAAAKTLLQEIDFKALADNIRGYLAVAGEDMKSFTENIGGLVEAVKTIGRAFDLVFNVAQAAILGLASAVSEFVSLAAKLYDAISSPHRAILEFFGVINEGQGDLSEFSGGMHAVAEEFAGRFANNAMEAKEALAKFGDEAAASTGKVKAGADELTTAGNKAAAASKAMGDAGNAGAAGLDKQAQSAKESAKQTQGAATQMEGAAERIKRAFSDLGIKSQQDLQRSAETAKRNFELIRDAVRSGEASAGDAKRAFIAYAEAARAAVADSDDLTKRRVDAELRVQAAALNVADALKNVGDAGQRMGSEVESGAKRASSALGNISSAAGSAGSSLGSAAAGAKSANEESKKGQGILAGYALKWDGLNDAAARALVSMNKYLVNGLTATHSLRYRLNIERLTAAMQEQLDTVRKLTAAAEAEGLQYDENAKRLAELRQQYKYVADSELQRLIDAENALKQGREESAAAAQQQAEAQAEAYREQREAAEAAEAAAAGSSLTHRSGGLVTAQSAQAATAAAEQVIDSAVAATQAMSRVVNSVEITLNVISKPPAGGLEIELSQQQINDISAAMIRSLEYSKRSSA